MALPEIARELIHGDFIFIWTNQEGFQYCPLQQAAMVHYLQVMKHLFIKTDEDLFNLKDILNHSMTTPARRVMVDTAMAQVFPCGLSALYLLNRNNQICLGSLMSKLDKCMEKFTSPTPARMRWDTGRGL